MVLSFFALLFYIYKQLRSTKVHSYKKAQYGIVKSKYFLRHSAERNGTKKYYVNVLFSDTNTYIKKVICTSNVYKTLAEGNEVLVLSFDNTKTYAIPVNTK